MKIEVINIQNLQGNKGQIKGLPKNPRIIEDEKYFKLKTSIENEPEMLALRELIVFPVKDFFVVICGNMRLKACTELQFTEIACKVLDKDTTLEKLKAYTILDNVSFGEHDWKLLTDEWDILDLKSWGVDIIETPAEIDYGLLGDTTLDQTLLQKTSGVKKAIQIEFESHDYDEAFAIVKFFRDRDFYVGKFLMESLKAEKAKIDKK